MREREQLCGIAVHGSKSIKSQTMHCILYHVPIPYLISHSSIDASIPFKNVDVHVYCYQYYELIMHVWSCTWHHVAILQYCLPWSLATIWYALQKASLHIKLEDA